jgi:hypothetical protein
MSNQYMGFEDAIGDEGYGIILDKNGNFMGIWSSMSLAADPYPDKVREFCITYFGVDPEGNQPYSITRH